MALEAALGVLDESRPENNPGNLRPAGASTGFRSFATPEEGISALDRNLQDYGKKGINTLSGVINRWAPPSENDTGAYVKHVSGVLGIPADQQIDLSDPVQRHAISTAIMLHEQGSKRIFGKKATATATAPAIQTAANDELPLSGALNELSTPETPASTEIAPPSNESSEGAWPGPFKGAPVDVLKAAGSIVASPGAAIAGGLEGIWTLGKELSQGKSFDDAAASAAKAVNERQGAVAFSPETSVGKVIAEALGSKFNPLNWPGLATKKFGELKQDELLALANSLQDKAPQLADKIRTASAVVGTTAETAGQAAMLFAGQRMEDLNRPLGKKTPAVTGQTATSLESKPNLSPLERIDTTAPQRIDLGLKVPEPGTLAAAVQSEPVKGGLPVAVQGERAAVLQRLGLKRVWNSALKGDALEGGTNAQTARFDQPAGRAAAEQFAHETETIKTAAADLATQAGGVLGDGQKADFARGSAIAAVGDKLRQWFSDTESKLYQAADEKTKGLPVVSTEPVESLLKDRTFKNSILAKDKGHLLSAIQDQLEVFKEANPEGLTVKTAEQFRQWLNQQWTPENSAFIGKVKGAVDDAVTKSAGEDVYQASRALHVAKQQTLENPKGINRLWDVDPRTPSNRAVKIEALPTEVERMSVEHFNELLNTLRNKIPPELQADAQAAESQMKAHFVQGILDAGTPDTKTTSPFWNNRKVNNYLAANESKMSLLFNREELARLADIRAGGNIISVDANYPGAAAQASNAAKQGLLGPAIANLVTATGGGAGAVFGSLFGLPGPGGVAGATLSRAAGERISAAAMERSALRKIQKRVIPLSEVGR